jgi:DnaD/phage-associated family protein
MASVLIHTADESVTITAQAAKRLLEKGDGDAALLYLALLRHHGTVAPRSLAGELRWDRLRIEAAEAVLREIGLVAPAAESLPPEPADEKPAYQRADITERLEKSGEFRTLTAEVEKKLGKKLTTPDIGVLLGLNDYLGLPSDVIYLLVCHCAERVARRYGEGRRPGMKQIEREGYAWARMGIDTQAAAAEYLKKYALRQGAMPQYMRALQLGDRPPVASEEKYLAAWQEMGFPPETVALAYDKTVLKCHELKWAYLNGILKRWHEAGLHTPEEVQSGDRPASYKTTGKAAAQPGGKAPEDVAWMKKYIQQRNKEV